MTLLSPLRPPRFAGWTGLPVPPGGPGVCAVCHGPAHPAQVRCWCCRQVGWSLGGPAPAPPVVPVALCRPGDGLHIALRRYKDSPAVASRRHFSGLLARLVTGFLGEHGDCLRRAAGPWEALAVVPSSRRGRAFGACPVPFDAVVAGVPWLAALPRIRLGPGPAVAGHLRPAGDAFSAPAEGRGRRVLLVDDTWVTGARAASAVAALHGAGASVAAVVVVGRLVDPAASPARAGWWRARETGQGGRASGCCLAECRRRRGPASP